MALLTVKGLKKHFPVRKGIFGKADKYVRAVDGVDFFLIEQRLVNWNHILERPKMHIQ